MENFKKLLDEAKKCVRCGICNSVCPTYNVLRKESVGPRGRVALIRERATTGDGAGFGKEFAIDLKACTLCGSCLGSCPRDVDVPKLILGARTAVVESEGLSVGAGLVFKNFLAPGKLAGLALKTASRLKRLLLKSSVGENGLLRRFSLPIIGKGRLVPNLADIFFLDRPEVKKLARVEAKEGRPRIGFFAGCGINYLMPEVGVATIKAVTDLGADLIIPSKQVCCGMPALSAGDRKTAKELAIKNLNAFEDEDLDYITTSCATCSNALKSVFLELLGDDPEHQERVQRFTSKVRDVTELLANELSYKDKGDKKEGLVTWHDPCHLSRYQGVREEPRELILKSGYAFKGMKNPCKCCGLGGGLVFSDYELSIEVTKKKAQNILSTKASIVATACPGCIVQLRDALHRYTPKDELIPKVVHVLELL